MNPTQETTNVLRLDVFTRVVHLGLILFGISSWLTGEWAEDYEGADPFGYTIHSWLGIGLLVVILLRVLWGFTGPRLIRFSSWVPYNRARISLSADDLRNLIRFRLPQRSTHEGLSGIVQSLGLLLFAWMAFTGILLYVGIVPGTEMGGSMEFVEELHEIGESLIPIYLFLHVGAVALHSLSGQPIWRKMLFLREKN